MNTLREKIELQNQRRHKKSTRGERHNKDNKQKIQKYKRSSYYFSYLSNHSMYEWSKYAL